MLWSALRSLRANGAKFRRQHPVGRYIVDFVDLNSKLVVEVDGGHHSGHPVKGADDTRTQWLEAEGYRVLRFWDNEVLTNVEGVASVIQQALGVTDHPHLSSPLKGEE